jgi:peptidoglycan/LPS O-acetylase OafA/YrhL
MTVTTERRSSRRLTFEMARRPDLQGMRAVAVLAVFADHLFEWPSGGFVGVDVFFVLSGFFITGLLLKERSKTGTLSFRRFYIRRVKRILPSALLVLVVTVGGAYLLFPAVRAKETLVDALWSALFAANFRFQFVGADYFQRDQPPSPLQHYWSLSIEEQFYFVWPVLLLLLFAATRTAYRRGRPRARQWGLFAGMAIIVGGSFGWALILSASNPNTAYFSTFTRVWELGTGALVAISGPWLVRIPAAARPVLAYVGLAGVALSLFVINSAVQFPAPWAALPVLSTALVIASYHGGDVRGMGPLTNPVARYLGDTSYTLYLWHWPVIILLMTVMPKGPLFYITAVVVALGLTVLTYHFYEDRIRKSNWLLEIHERRDRRAPRVPITVWAMTAAAMASVLLVSILLIQRSDRLAAANTYQSVVQMDAPPPQFVPEVTTTATSALAPLTTPLPGADPCFGAPAILNGGCALRNPDVALQPSIDKFATDSGSPTCWTGQGQPLKSCTYGYTGPDATRIALVGDSHAARVLVAVVPYLQGLKWQLTTYLGWGCSWQQPAQESCTAAMPDIQRGLLDKPYALVLTTASRNWGDAGSYAAAWEPVAAAGSRIAVLQDNPGVSEESIACLTRVSLGGDKTGDCGTPRADALKRDDPLVGAAAQIPAAKLIDLTQYYCTPDRCPTVIGNVIVYGDVGAHVTATYIRTLAPAIVDGMRQVLA